MRTTHKILGILQPCYLPWLGFFEQMAMVDHFVLLDDVQYTRQDWRNRNRIKTSSGVIWLTVPIQRRSHKALLNEIMINDETRWQRRHLRSIAQSYSKCPFFQPLYADLEREIAGSRGSLVDLDCRLIRLLAGYLDIDVSLSFASEVPKLAEGRNERIRELLRAHRAICFYEGASGRDYLDVELLNRAGIGVVFQDYRHPVYRQVHGDFVSHLSAIDLIMNTGPEAPAILRSSPLPYRLTHDGLRVGRA